MFKAVETVARGGALMMKYKQYAKAATQAAEDLIAAEMRLAAEAYLMGVNNDSDITERDCPAWGPVQAARVAAAALFSKAADILDALNKYGEPSEDLAHMSRIHQDLSDHLTAAVQGNLTIIERAFLAERFSELLAPTPAVSTR